MPGTTAKKCYNKPHPVTLNMRECHPLFSGTVLFESKRRNLKHRIALGIIRKALGEWKEDGSSHNQTEIIAPGESIITYSSNATRQHNGSQNEYSP